MRQTEIVSVLDLAARNKWATARNNSSRLNLSLFQSLAARNTGATARNTFPKFLNTVLAALFHFVTARSGMVAARNTQLGLVLVRF